MAFFWAEEPCAVKLPDEQFADAAELSPVGSAVLSDPQAVSASVAVKAMPAR
jgi:hypothetical protein